jgi:O-antigen/teichoic acid export membrane protein
MNKSLRAILSLSWQSAVYGVGILGSQLVVYILLPFLTRYVSREEYGAITVITSLYAFLNILTNAGIPSATFRYYSGTVDEADKRLTIAGSQFLFFIFAAIPAIGILIFPKLISTLLLGSDQYALVLQLVAWFLIVDSMNTFGAVILQAEARALASSLHGIFLITVKTSLALLFVTKFDMGVFGYWLGHLIGESLGFIVMVWLVWDKISFHVSRSRVFDLVSFGFPLIPTALSLTFLRVADRYIIGSLAGLDQVAVYDVGYKVGSIILLLIAPFRTAWNPFAFSIAHKPEAPRIYRDVLTYLMAACSFLFLAVFAFRFQLIQLMVPASYQEAVSVVSWVAFSQLFFAAYMVLAIGLMITKRTHRLAWIAVAASVANLLLNFILIPSLGIVGAAVATFIGYTLLALLAYFAGKSSFNMQIDWSRIAKLALVTGVIALIILTAEQLIASSWMESIMKILGLISFPVLLLITQFLNPLQTRQLFEMVRGSTTD